MYGLVNRAVEGLVCARHGADAWRRIKGRAGVREEVFVSSAQYPDTLTYELVAAASAELGVSADDILIEFGEYWVREIAAQSYGPLFEAAGRDLGSFIDHLPHFHTRVGLILPALRPPRFAVSERRARSLRLHYLSDREGLAPFVRGLIQGLSAQFATPVEIHELPVNAQEPDERAVFALSW